MASLAQIRTAIASTITSAIAGLEGHDKVPESINVPGFMVVPRSTDFDKAFGRGLDGYGFDVIVLVSRTVDELAQSALDDYLNGFGSKSIRQAVWNNRTLGLGVDASVTGMSDYGATFEVGGVEYVGGRLAVDVLTSGNA
jgi:hypothetical protein